MTAPLPAPQHVFTTEWVAAQKARYEGRPAHARPVHYDLWTADEFQARRDAIEASVEALPEQSRAVVVPRLRTERHFDQTRAELAVGCAMRRLGYDLDYERELVAGLTPDWYLRHPVRRPFVIEVVSSKLSETRDRCERAWEQFSLRLRALPGDAVLDVGPSHVGLEPVGPPDARQQKVIVRAVKRWLADGRPCGDKVEFDGVVVEFVATVPGLTHVETIGSSGLWVDGAPLRESVADKASKYRPLVEAIRQPFVVVVVPDFFTGRGMDELKDAVLGHECWREANTRAGGKGDLPLVGDGLFAKYPTLSAVALGTWVGHSITLVVLRNAVAACPLGPDSFTATAPLASGAYRNEPGR